jgi:diguanylate cyclase
MIPFQDLGRLAAATLDALPHRMCVLATSGTVALVNHAWRKAESYSQSSNQIAPGDNYLTKCESLGTVRGDWAPQFASGVRSVLAGTVNSFELEYCLTGGLAETWFKGTAARFENANHFWVLLAHTDVTEQHAQATKLSRSSHIRAISSGVNSLMLRERNRDQLFQAACQVVIDDGYFMMAWIGIVGPGNTNVDPVASAGVGDYIETAPPAIFSILPDSELPIARVVRTMNAVYSNDVRADPQIIVKAKLAARGIRSLALLPLVVDGIGVGVFAIYAADTGVFDADERQLLNQLAQDISFSLEYTEKGRQLDYLVHHDAVTGLPNRGRFVQLLRQAVLSADSAQTKLAVLLIDFDGFKAVSDTLGRADGDNVLRLVATRIAKCVGGEATVGRLEGAEFAVILPTLPDPTDAGLAAKRMLVALAKRFDVANQDSYLAAHIGIALFPADSESADTLLMKADAAVFSARAEERHSFKFYTAAMNADALRKSQLELGLRRALERDEFVLHYQPKVDTISGRMVGMEALLRWASPGVGLVPPLDFIPMLEETGLILEVGEWVLRTACKQIAAWRISRVGAVHIAVNLSGRQFQQEGLGEMISAILREFDIPASSIEIEITESALMVDPVASALVLDGLRSLGIWVSIDDFGTGYSSLSYLKRLPLDSLKIDRAFISDVTTNPDDAAITRAIITMSHSMNLKVIAEGVETEEQFAFLRSNHCDEVQGYLFSKPVTAEGMTELLLSGRGLHGGPSQVSGYDVPTILLVDDDKAFRMLLKELFADDGYQVLTAASPKYGFDILALHKVDIIISDENMPGMQGVEFLNRVRRIYPSIVRIMMTGQDDARTVTAAVNDGEVFKFFVKQRDEDLLHREVARRFHRKARAALVA